LGVFLVPTEFGSYWPQLNAWIYGLLILILSAYFLTSCVGDSNLELRLANGSSKCAGRVEVKFQGQWGLVCNDGWGRNEISVVCKQLGCPSTFIIPGWRNWTVEPGPFWLAGVSCHGSESALWDCRHNGWKEHNCSHSQDAQVACTSKSCLYLLKTSSEKSPKNRILRIRARVKIGFQELSEGVGGLFLEELCVLRILLPSPPHSLKPRRRGQPLSPWAHWSLNLSQVLVLLIF
ncbi:scavenger receptor cysteine-rich type 1 protein M130-like, partial [Vombatus ursinus]|uniref:scavenger receptor cysteine-rich type 1 protein M130-like n=1 Tax=Vombatus ursinus TaxID=29139 RepID=UPI000FFCF1BC